MARDGTKTGGGSRKGRPNKNNAAKLLKIEEYCAQKGYDPLRAMVDLATAPDKDKLAIDIKMACHKELAKYLHSQRKAHEHTGKDGGAIKISVELSKLK